MVKSIPESGEKLFWRAFKYSIVRSLPFAALPLICAPILSVGGYSHAKYLGGFLVCCILSVACAAGANVYFIYRSFPRANDKKSGCICHALMLSAFISTLVAIVSSFGGGAIFGAITKTGHAGAFLLILNNAFTAAFLLFCAAHMVTQSLFAATCFAVIKGKRKRRGVVSRTCRAAVPIFTVLCVYYVVAILLFTFADMSFTANIAVEYFLTYDVMWLVASLIPIAAAAYALLWLLCAKSANKQ